MARGYQLKTAAILFGACLLGGELYADRSSAADWPTLYQKAGADTAQIDGTECYWERKSVAEKSPNRVPSSR
jgi:hypothetical protein